MPVRRRHLSRGAAGPGTYRKKGSVMKRLFKGGTIVSGDGMRKVDLLVKGEKILAVGEDLEFRDA